MKLFAKGRVEVPVNKIVRLFHADLTAGLSKVSSLRMRSRSQRLSRGRWPLGHLFIEQFRRPPAPGKRTSANGKDEPAVVERRMVEPGNAQIGRASHERQVLHVLREDKRPGFEHKNASATRGIGDKKMLRDDGTESPAADDDKVEFALVAADVQHGAIERFLQRITEKASHVIEGKRGGFRSNHRKVPYFPVEISLLETTSTLLLRREELG